MKLAVHIHFLVLIANIALGQSLPSSLKHNILPSGQHEYTIKKVYIEHPRDALLMTKYYRKKIPECNSFTVNTNKKSILFLTSSAITNLQDTCNRFAREGGMFPYWEELEMRDKQSPSYDRDLYTLAFKTNIISAVNERVTNLLTMTNKSSSIDFTLVSSTIQNDGRRLLADYNLSYDKGQYKYIKTVNTRWIKWNFGDFDKYWHWWSEQPLNVRYKPASTGQISLNKTIALCPCCQRYALRIFDKEGKYIWEDQNHIKGNKRVIVHDFDNDGIDEIIIYQHDHGEQSLLIFKRT